MSFSSVPCLSPTLDTTTNRRRVIPPFVPDHVARSTFALFWGLNNKQDPENMFLGTAFTIAPCIAISAAHHMRLSHDDCGRLNLRPLRCYVDDDDNDADADGGDKENTKNSTRKGKSVAAANHPASKSSHLPSSKAKVANKNNIKNSKTKKASDKEEEEEEMEKEVGIAARVSYVQKDRDVDILIMWLDRPVAHHVPLRAFHPLVDQKVMLVSAAITDPHCDLVTSTGTVTRSPTNNPDAVTTLCRAKGLLSARGYSGSLVLEYLGASISNNNDNDNDQNTDKNKNAIGETDENTTSNKTKPDYVFHPLPKQRVVGMHVSVYRSAATKHNLEAEFVSAYRIIKTLTMYNVDVFSSYAQGTAAKIKYQCEGGRGNGRNNNKNEEEEDDCEEEKRKQRRKSGTRRQRGE